MVFGSEAVFIRRQRANVGVDCCVTKVVQTTSIKTFTTMAPSRSILSIETLDVEIPSHLQTSGKPLLIQSPDNDSSTTRTHNQKLILIHNCLGSGQRSIYYHPAEQRFMRPSEVSGPQFDTFLPHQVVLLHDQYLIGQSTSDGSVHCYNMQTRQRFSLPRFPSGGQLVGSALLATQACLFVIGGKDPNDNFMGSCAYKYTPFPWRLESLPSFQTPRRNATAVEIDRNVYLIGGCHYNRYRSRYEVCDVTEVYNQDRREWTYGPSLNRARANAVVLHLHNSIIVMGGSRGQERTVKAIEVWNLETNRFVVWKYFERSPPSNLQAIVLDGSGTILLFGEAFLQRVTILEDDLSREALEPLIVALGPPPPLPAPFHTPVSEEEELTVAATEANAMYSCTPVEKASATTVVTEANSSLAISTLTDMDHSTAARTQQVILPNPPERPNLPINLTLVERCEALKTYILQLERLQKSYQNTIQTAATRIATVYDEARDLALDELNFHGSLWLSDTERLVSDARQELQPLQQNISREQDYIKNELNEQLHEDTYLDGIPSQLRCPITLNLMEDPVVAADGNTYDRHALEKWFRNQSPTKPLSPLTGAVLPSKQYFPVHTLKALCQHFARQRKQPTQDRLEV